MMTITVTYGGGGGTHTTTVDRLAATVRLLELLNDPTAILIPQLQMDGVPCGQVVFTLMRDDEAPDTVAIIGACIDVDELNAIIEARRQFRRAFCHAILKACGVANPDVRQRIIHAFPTTPQLTNWLAFASEYHLPVTATIS